MLSLTPAKPQPQPSSIADSRPISIYRVRLFEKFRTHALLEYADKYNVLNTRSFSDILIDRVLEDHNLKDSSHSFNAGWESTLDPHGMAQILAQTETHNFARSNRNNPYKAKARAAQGPASSAQRTFTMAAASARAPHAMNPEQLQAFECIKQFVPQLPNNFEQRQLKTAYRLSVLKAHPDQGGTSETFQNVKKSYQILTALVKNEA